MGGMAHCKRKNDEVIVVLATYGSFRGVWVREMGRKLIFYNLKIGYCRGYYHRPYYIQFHHPYCKGKQDVVILFRYGENSLLELNKRSGLPTMFCITSTS